MTETTGSSRPGLDDMVREGVRAGKAVMHTAVPAKVLSYDKDTGPRVSLQIIPKFRRRNAATDEWELYTPPPLTNVPVCFPHVPGFGMTFPLAVGNAGMVVFAERSMDEWLSTGESSTDPQDPRRFDLEDGVFYPGLPNYLDPTVSTAVDTAALVVEGAQIKLGSSAATDFVALASLVIANWTSFLAAIAAVTIVPGDGGAAIKAAIGAWDTAGNPQSVAATKVKAE